MNYCSDTILCWTVPLRIFLCDVEKFAKQSDSDLLFRLMGTIVEILPQEADHKCSNLLGFVIDDGSGTVTVFSNRKVKTETSWCQHRTPQPHLRQQGIELGQHQCHLNPSLLSSSLPILKVGQTVDCIGKFIIGTGHKASNNDLTCNSIGEQQQLPQIWLAASTVSIVTSPQESSLRQIELCLCSYGNDSRNNNTIETSSTIGGNPDDDKSMPKNRILSAGDLNLKLNSLFYSNNHHQNQHRQQCGSEVTFNPDDAFRYIRFSKDEGGISVSDLALLVGAAKAKEKMAVKAAVEYLQNEGMVYLKQGKYYPL